MAPVDAQAHAVDRYLALAGALGADLPVSENLEWPFPPSAVPEGGGGFFSQKGPFVALHPFSRGRGKSMTRAEVTGLCEALAPVPVVLLGRSDEVLPAMGHVENLLNQTTLTELLAVLSRAAWTISVDSGPMHMAAALSARVVAVHTWSDPDRVGPYPKSAWVLKGGRLAMRANWKEGGGISIPRMGPLGDWVKGWL
jgi:ADP-heptose:LPS heptosyltransferase